jgi:hypothetical protein
MKTISFTLVILLTFIIIGIAQTSNNLNTKFVFKSYPEDTNGTPYSDIVLSFGKKVAKIDKVAGNADITDQSLYAENKIPKTALSACGSWWAGAGDYYYVVQEKNKLVIYKGWQAEEQTDKGFHWKRYKSVVL